MEIEMIEIDGSYQEAGGQILRTATSLSILTQRPFRIFNIRKGRPKAGLKPQHLTGMQAAAQICNAQMKGADLGSTELSFEPGELKPGDYKFDIGTAGAISMVMQTLSLPASVAKGRMSFEIVGGTDVSWSPSMNYFDMVFSYYLEKMGCAIFTQIIRYGFYPKGGGKVKVTIEPTEQLKPLVLTERGKFLRIDGKSIATSHLKQAKVAERQLESAEKILGAITNKSHNYVDSLSDGSTMQLHADYENCRVGAGALGQRGKPAEKVGEEAANLLNAQMDSGACLDRWMTDQILPFIALATVQTKKPSEVSVAELSNHALTNAWVIEQFLPVKFDIQGEKKQPGRISVSIQPT